MEKNQYIVALEIGSSKIVGAIAEKTPAGYLNVKHLLEEKHLNSVRYGIVQNVENIKTSISRILRQLESMVDGRITKVYLGVSGKSLHSVGNEVTRSIGTSEAITSELIDRILHDAISSPIKDHDTIDVVPSAYYVDKSLTNNPVGQYGSQIKMIVNLIIAKPKLMANLNRLMTFGVNVQDYIVTPLAAGEKILTDNERMLGCMLVDMGAETTTVTIYKNGALKYLNTLPLGGRNLTRDLVNGLSVLEDTAENVKKNINNPLDPANVNNVVIEGINSREASEYIAARMGEIIANINQQLANAGVTSDDVKKIVLIGGCANMGGIQQKLAETLNIGVRLGQNPSSLNIMSPEHNRLEYIEMFSLLAMAADKIDANDTCVEIHTYDDGPGINIPQPEPEPEPRPAKPEHVQESKKKGLFHQWAKRLGSLMAEEEDDQ